MGRNVKQGFNYFSLDVDIFSDIKIRKLIKNHSGRALSVYICVLAFIYRNGYYVLNDEDFGFIVSEQTGDKVEFIEAVLDYCVKVGLFSAEMFEQGVYTSKGVQERYLAMCKASRRNIVFSEYTLISSEEMGINSEEIAINSEKTPIKKSKVNNISFLEKKKQKSASVKKSGIEEIDFEELSVEMLKEEKEKNSAQKEKEKSSAKAFTPPSPAEVAAYCRERGNDISPESFCSFYASKGWRVGNQPMKDWRAAIRHWETRRSHENKQPSFPKNKQSQPLVIDENGNILSAETNNNTTQANTYVAGRQTAASLSANLQGW